MQTAYLLIAASTLITGTLGALHLLFTYVGQRFDPRDPALALALQTVSPRISGQTTMARAAKGFHASHSLGVLLFAVVWGYLALWQSSFLQQSAFLQYLGLGFLLTYVALAKRYWFNIPLWGISAACCLYAAGLLLLTL